jgi:hypothetical protein
MIRESMKSYLLTLCDGGDAPVLLMASMVLMSRSPHRTLDVSECRAHRDAIAHRTQSCAGRTQEWC